MHINIVEAEIYQLPTIQRLIQETIQTIYPKYYPKGAVQFFLSHHSTENIKKALIEEKIYLFLVGDNFVGTGSIHHNEINRFFKLPEHQKKDTENLQWII